MPAGRRKRDDPRRRGPRARLGRGARRLGNRLRPGGRRPQDERSKRERRRDSRRDRRRVRRERKKNERKLRKRRWRRKERKARRKQARKDRRHRRRRRIRRVLLLPLLLLFLMLSCTSLTTMAALSAMPDPSSLMPDIDVSAIGDALGDLFGFGGGGPNVLGSTARYRESMITATTQRMLDAVIPRFGQGYGVGCYRTGDSGEHPRGRACDFIMARPLNTMPTPEYLQHGWALCNFLIANADELHIRYIIWQKRIWFPASGWHPYTRYDGVTQGELLRLNHYDHVHVSVNWVEGDRVI
jgi:hypothetical protein